MSQGETITIDDASYSVENLSSNAKIQLANLHFVDGEIVRLQNQLAVYRMARIGYAEQLKKELPAQQ